jgi:thiamine biosynthesis lipoprotein ApbE
MGIGRASWRALGTSVHVLTTDESLIAAAAAVVRAALVEVDETYSRFRDDSELSRLNAGAGSPTVVTPLLMSAITTAIRGARCSDGAVDPTVGRAMRLIGYDRDFAGLPRDGGPITLVVEEVRGWRAVRVDPAAGRVSIPAGVELDLGSTGKALAADVAAAAAHRATERGGVLVSLGGDIATAGDAPQGGWRVLVAEDSEAPPDGDGETVCIDGGGLATSGITVRSWTRGGIALHHIIDPRTGLPARGPWRTVTVAAATCVDANIAATAAIVRGEDAVQWLEALALPARLVSLDGAVQYAAAWPVPVAS